MMRRLFLIAVLSSLLIGCGGPAGLRDVSIEPISVTRIDTVHIGTDFGMEVLADGAVAAIEYLPDGGRAVTLVDRNLKRSWRREISSDQPTIDHRAVHFDAGRLLVPIFERTSRESFAYTLFSYDSATGRTLDSMTLMRFNQHDLSGLEDIFTRYEWKSSMSTQTAWSPDSSKFILYKYYPSSRGRLAMEMMLFKKGFVLVTKTNIDFQFDRERQRLLALQLDNDGVAYLGLFNANDTSFEVGRFEILGSKQLRPLKYKAPRLPDFGRFAIAPRGHVYFVSMTEHANGQRLELVDFDFYRDTAISKEAVTASRSNHAKALPPLWITVKPWQDRILIAHEGRNVNRNEVEMIAYDLDLLQQWKASYSKPAELLGRHSYFSEPELLGGYWGSLYADGDMMRFTGVAIRDGKRHDDPRYKQLARIEQLLPTELDAAIFRDGVLYIPAGNTLYRLVLP